MTRRQQNRKGRLEAYEMGMVHLRSMWNVDTRQIRQLDDCSYNKPPRNGSGLSDGQFRRKYQTV
jgi:hypothetical protein